MDLNYILLLMIKGELISVKFTPGNVDDKVPVLDLTEGLRGSFNY